VDSQTLGVVTTGDDPAALWHVFMVSVMASGASSNVQKACSVTISVYGEYVGSFPLLQIGALQARPPEKQQMTRSNANAAAPVMQRAICGGKGGDR